MKFYFYDRRYEVKFLKFYRILRPIFKGRIIDIQKLVQFSFLGEVCKFYRGNPVVLMLYNNFQLKGRQTQLLIEVHKQVITLRATSFGYLYNHHQAHTKCIILI